MNKWLLLLIVGGLAAVGWFHHETISEWVAQKTGRAIPSPELEQLDKPGRPAATPNPAADSVAQARRIYPALAKAGSPFNLRFVALFKEMQASNPDFLAKPDWPIRLAERTAKDLGGAAMPRSGSGTRGTSGWTDDYAAAVENAKSEKKKLLLDFTGSDWCGYCKDLEKEVFSTSKFQSWARDNVVLVRVDFPNGSQTIRVKEQNAALKAKYPFNGFPTIMIVDTAGNVLGRESGYTPGSGPDAYIATLERTMKR